MAVYKKKFLCQTGAKKYGLKDIELGLDKNVEFLCYGVPFAEKITYDGEVYDYVSYFKEDKKKGCFEDTLAYKLLTDPNVYTPCYYKQNGGDTTVEKYKLIYFNPECGIMKPTVLYSYSPNKEKCAKVLCEYLFVFENEWLFSYEEVAEVTNIGFAPYDYILSCLQDLGEFKRGRNFFLSNAPNCSYDEENETISLEVCNLKGEFKTLTFSKEQWKEIVYSFCSARIIGVEEPGTEYQKLKIT